MRHTEQEGRFSLINLVSLDSLGAEERECKVIEDRVYSSRSRSRFFLIHLVNQGK